MNLDLPLHPTMRHPITGEPIRALWVDPNGRARYPIMGGAPEGGDGAADEAAAAAQATADAAKAAADAASAKAAEGTSDYPANTPVAEMTHAQQAAYYKAQSRKHEERATEYRTAAGGKTAAEVAAGLKAAEDARVAALSAQEQAIEKAKNDATKAAAADYAPKAVKAAIKLLLGDMPEAEQDAEIELLDLSKFLTDSGDIDTAKVRRAAEKIAPAVKGGEQRIRNFGAGDRQADKTTGVSSGRSLFEEKRGKSKTPTTAT